MDRGAWWATVHGVAESDMTEQASKRVFHCVCVCESRTCFTYLPVDGHWGCFHVLATVSSAAVNVRMHVSFPVIVLSRYMSKVDHTATLLSVFWATVAAPIYSLTLPHPWQRLVFVDFLIMATLTGMKSYFLVVLFCIFLMITNVEHLFMWLLAICISSLEKFLFSSYFIRFVVFFGCWVVWAVYICWLSVGYDPYRSYHLQIFSPVQ